jgi:RNA polymerase sigma factor (sigma-70 family)
VTKNSEPNLNVKDMAVEQLVVYLRTGNAVEVSACCEELIIRFEPLLRRHWPRNNFKIEYSDFVQDVFLKLFRGLPRLEDPKAFPGYFLKVVQSVATDLLRRDTARPTVGAENFDHLVTHIDQEMVTGIFLRSYLEHLESRQRTVLSLEFFEELSNKEIAKSLGTSPGVVRVIKSRALKRLRTLLLEDADSLERK